MSIQGMSSKNPTIKRIMKEASELNNSPSSDYHAAPLEDDMFEWHFTIRGPPAPSPFDGGIYHGRIVLPPAYPMKPPSFRFTTPTGRFEVNREICLSISGHHEETWQPAWGIRTALVAIRSFMDTDAKGQLGGMDASDEARRRFAKQSAAFRCPACARTNVEIMKEQEEAVVSSGSAPTTEPESIPDELRLAYRDELSETARTPTPKTNVDAASPQPAASTSDATQAVQVTLPRTQAPVEVRQTVRPVERVNEELPFWIDKAIYGVIAALLALIYIKYLV